MDIFLGLLFWKFFCNFLLLHFFDTMQDELVGFSPYNEIKIEKKLIKNCMLLVVFYHFFYHICCKSWYPHVCWIKNSLICKPGLSRQKQCSYLERTGGFFWIFSAWSYEGGHEGRNLATSYSRTPAHLGKEEGRGREGYWREVWCGACSGVVWWVLATKVLVTTTRL